MAYKKCKNCTNHNSYMGPSIKWPACIKCCPVSFSEPTYSEFKDRGRKNDQNGRPECIDTYVKEKV